MTTARAGLLVVGLVAATANAWPVDWAHDVEPGKEKFLKLPRVDQVEVEDSTVATLEWMHETNELMISGLKPGRTLVMLSAEGKVAVWRVRVGQKPQKNEALFAAAQKACPGLRSTPDDDVKMTVPVKTEACWKALALLFETDAVEARHLELEFDGAVLQAQLNAVQQGLDGIARGRFTAKYIGAGLVLSGRCTELEHRQALWVILKKTVGRFALDDQTDVLKPDAG